VRGRKLKLAEIVGDYIGAPYKLGGSSYDEGFDCLRLVLKFGEDNIGVKIPDSYGGVTLDTYPELWEKDPVKAKILMLGLFEEIAEKIPPYKAFVTDILLLRDQEGDNVGIHVGQGLVLSVFTNIGVQLANINGFEVRGAYRWVVRDIGI
jgi:cell wall-associated NlpC family hydrolase